MRLRPLTIRRTDRVRHIARFANHRLNASARLWRDSGCDIFAIQYQRHRCLTDTGKLRESCCVNRFGPGTTTVRLKVEQNQLLSVVN